MVDPQVISEWLKKADEDFEFPEAVNGIPIPLPKFYKENQKVKGVPKIS